MKDDLAWLCCFKTLRRKTRRMGERVIWHFLCVPFLRLQLLMSDPEYHLEDMDMSLQRQFLKTGSDPLLMCFGFSGVIVLLH